ncbi:7628_t:CDS:2, partial [Racocetra persica]
MPSSNVSVDEMIARFTGRSVHTVRMKSKPTPEGYKILSLYDSGYTWIFSFLSRVEKATNLPTVQGINEIGQHVCYLVFQLPLQSRAFTIYIDNFFTSIPLFQHLWNNRIGACGTVRTNSANNNTQNPLDSEEFCTYLVWELIQASVSQVPNTRNLQYSITNPPVSN